MDLGRMMTGVVIGGLLGATGAMFAFTSDRERKLMMRQSRRMMNRTMGKLNDLM